MAERVLLSAVLRAARRKLPIVSDKYLRENLRWAVGNDIAEAYRVGAEEAQYEIARRLAAMSKPSASTPNPGTEQVNK